MDAHFCVDAALGKNRKFRDLGRRLGSPQNAAWLLVRLWSFTAAYRPDGDLSGIDPAEIPCTDIEWQALIDTRIEKRYPSETKQGFLSTDESGHVRVHDWVGVTTGDARRPVVKAKRRYPPGGRPRGRPRKGNRYRVPEDPPSENPGHPTDAVSVVQTAAIGFVDTSGPRLLLPPTADPAPTGRQVALVRPEVIRVTWKSPELQEWLEKWFQWFWAIYPRKQSKVAARNAWDRLHFKKCKGGGGGITPQLRQSILEHIKSMVSEGYWDPGTVEGIKGIPHAATYLNQERWTDE